MVVSGLALSVRCWGCCCTAMAHPVDLTELPALSRRVLPRFFAALPDALCPRPPVNALRQRRARARGAGSTYLLLTASQRGDDAALLRALRSESQRWNSSARRALPLASRAQLPQLSVITANIQPVHMAIMEGEQENLLHRTAAGAGEVFNGVPLWIRPQSFFQTNPAVASRLYATARDWVRALPVQHMWDLFCGVGGFGLHCATPTLLTGIEIAPEAIACAGDSQPRNWGSSNLHFQARWTRRSSPLTKRMPPQLVLVNPPRRPYWR